MKLVIKGILAFLSLGGTGTANAKAIPLEKIKLPPGFSISVFAEVPDARSLTQSEAGIVFVGTKTDKVYAVEDKNNDGKGDKVYTIISGLNEPNGVAFQGGALYVAEISKLHRFKNIEANLSKPSKPESLPTEMPSDAHHGWKFIAFGPDGKLYIPVGAPCNVCDKGDKYSAIFRVDAEGRGKELFAKGIRNTVGFDWHPVTKELYFTDNGRDMMGDDTPDDELNRATKGGLDFGFPRCHAGNVRDPEFGKDPKACEGSEKPVALLGPHVAALGMRFYKGSQFPQPYRGRIFIAQHGSWNRSKPIGYQVVTATLVAGGQAKIEPFATGWLEGSQAWGRPVDVLERKDGSLLISDDKSSVIYRVTYKGP